VDPSCKAPGSTRRSRRCHRAVQARARREPQRCRRGRESARCLYGARRRGCDDSALGARDRADGREPRQRCAARTALRALPRRAARRQARRGVRQAGSSARSDQHLRAHRPRRRGVR
jgi:hypothetical protein